MSNAVVNYYENYHEEDRITTNNARRIEFLTTVHKFDELLSGNLDILDCAAGTGAYAFYLADKGHNLTATNAKTWFKYHLSVCSDRSIINMSNHVISVGKKK